MLAYIFGIVSEKTKEDRERLLIMLGLKDAKHENYKPAKNKSRNSVGLHNQ